jgi:hypothetical protein
VQKAGRLEAEIRQRGKEGLSGYLDGCRATLWQADEANGEGLASALREAARQVGGSGSPARSESQRGDNRPVVGAKPVPVWKESVCHATGQFAGRLV